MIAFHKKIIFWLKDEKTVTFCPTWKWSDVCVDDSHSECVMSGHIAKVSVLKMVFVAKCWHWFGHCPWKQPIHHIGQQVHMEYYTATHCCEKISINSLKTSPETKRKK